MCTTPGIAAANLDLPPPEPRIAPGLGMEVGMRLRIPALAASLLLLGSVATARPGEGPKAPDDPVARAMAAELERSVAKLKEAAVALVGKVMGS